MNTMTSNQLEGIWYTHSKFNERDINHHNELDTYISNMMSL